MNNSALRYSTSFNSNFKYLAHLYWEDYELNIDLRHTPIECVFFLEDCIMTDAIIKQSMNKSYNLFIDILWEVFREKTSLNKENLRSLVNSLQSWYWSECETDQDLNDRWLAQEQLGQVCLAYPSIFDASWVERNFFRK